MCDYCVLHVCIVTVQLCVCVNAVFMCAIVNTLYMYVCVSTIIKRVCLQPEQGSKRKSEVREERIKSTSHSVWV